jgi:hypothetical protein
MIVHGHVEESQVSAMLLRLAMISEDQFSGNRSNDGFGIVNVSHEPIC